MNRRPLALAICALGLAAVVVWDYWPKAVPIPAVQVVKARPQDVALLNPLSQRPREDFQALLDQPLFDPSRTPPAAAVELPDAPQITQAPAVVAAELVLPLQPVLMGTVTSPLPGGAYVGDDAGGLIVFLRPGQTAQGLTLQTVFAESAVFMGPDGSVTLTLQAMPAPQADTEPVFVPDMSTSSSTTLPNP